MLRLTGIMGMLAAFASSAFARSVAPVFRAGTRRRRGRVHSTRKNRPGSQRLAPAIVGGNWQGQQYLTYAEHDQCVRSTLDELSYSGSRAEQYERTKREIIAERSAQS